MSSSPAPAKHSLVYFGPFEVTDQVFHTTPHSYALVNIKPLLPGHVLVIPFRKVRRLTSLTTTEIADLFTTVQKVQRMLGGVYFTGEAEAGFEEGGSFNIAIQDGKDAGQTVEHVHVHVIPRVKLGEGEKGEGDEIYDRLASEQGNVGGGLWDQVMMKERPKQGGKFPKIEDEDRKPRSVEEMNKEAAFFKKRMRALEEGS